MVFKRVINFLPINSYACNELYNKICLADYLTELKGGLKK